MNIKSCIKNLTACNSCLDKKLLIIMRSWNDAWLFSSEERKERKNADNVVL